MPIDLAARRWLVIENERAQPACTGLDGGGHAGRPGADDDKVVMRSGCHWPASSARVTGRKIRMPSSAYVWQACSTRPSSSVIMQSKQTPIMQ